MREQRSSDSEIDAIGGVIASVLLDAKRQGATAAEAAIVKGRGLSVTVRMGEVETVEHHQSKQLAVTVFVGGRKSTASTSELEPALLHQTVTASCAMAWHGNEDEFAGLADPELMARSYPDLDLCHPWLLDPNRAISIGQVCEGSALAYDPRIRNSDGATVGSHTGIYVYGNSHGFVGGWASTRCSISCAVLAGDEAGMQRDYWLTTSRNPHTLLEPSKVGEIAAARAIGRLGARPLSTRTAPVLFEARSARRIFSHFVSAIAGGNLYRKGSFLVDHLGKQVFHRGITVSERPHLRQGIGSAPFDNDGVATTERTLVEEGVLRGYVLSSYSARKLRMRPTGNSGGVHNLVVTAGCHDLGGLIAIMDTGLLVTDLMGFGVNIVTGDYSQGATGFWVEGGEIQFPVEEVTIAGNLKDMFMGLREVGNDVDTRGNIHTGSVLVANMMLAGRKGSSPPHSSADLLRQESEHGHAVS